MSIANDAEAFDGFWKSVWASPKAIWATGPLITGGGLAVALIAFMYHGSDSLNALKWPLIHYSPTKSYAVLFILLLSNMWVVFWGTILYFFDFQEKLQDHGTLSGGSFKWGQRWVLVCLGGIIGWAFYFWYTILLTSYNLKIDSAVSDFVQWNTVFSLGIFIGFGVCDFCNLQGCKRLRWSARKEKLAAKEALFSKRADYCRDSILLIDAPVIAGCLLLLAVKLIIGGHLGDIGLQKFGQYPDAKLTQLLQSLHSPGGAEIRKASEIRGWFETILARDFEGGFSTGSLICELAFSQIVFMILNFRITAFEHHLNAPEK